MPRFLLPTIVFGAALVAFPFFFLKLALFALIVGGAIRFMRRRDISTNTMHHQQHRHRHVGPFSQSFRAMFGGWRRPKYNVPMNVADHGDHYEVRVYAVSFDKADITVRVANDQLIIQGTRTHDAAGSPDRNDPNFLLQEYPLKSFERALPISNRVDTTGIVARQEDGVLILTIPKKPEVVVEVA